MDRPDLGQKEMAKVNYKDFLDRIEQARLTFKEFGKREGIISHIVGNYLKRASEEKGRQNGFAMLEVKKPVVQVIRITRLGSVIIEIPL